MRSFCLRFFLIVIALLWGMTVLAGCSKAREEAKARQLMESFSQHFESEFSCTLDGLELEGRISRPDPGSGLVEITAPQSLAGLTFRVDADHVEISYSGLNFALDKSAGGFAELSPFPRALGALSTLLTYRPEELPVRERDFWRIDATVDGKKCSLLVAQDTGLPVKLLLEGGDLELLLKNFTFLG
ncbi:MAG TPA: hypothetical protein GX499_08110 [Clostridiales bacterium]|nr:hypothetical protein [Clostridiales bacterium]